MKKSISILLLALSISAFSQDLPCKSYYPGGAGGRCKERYKEDSNGDRHGLYIQYTENGKVYLRGNVVHGTPEGSWFVSVAYIWYVKGECVKYKLYTSDFFGSGWSDECAYSTKPITSLEEAKAVSIKLNKKNQQEFKLDEQKNKKEKQEKEEKEAREGEERREKDLKDQEKKEQERIERDGYTPEEQAERDKVSKEYVDLIFLKYSSDKVVIKNLVSKGESFLNNSRNRVFLNSGNNRLDLLEAIIEAKGKLNK